MYPKFVCYLYRMNCFLSYLFNKETMEFIAALKAAPGSTPAGAPADGPGIQEKR
jgi:hypothetical protein